MQSVFTVSSFGQSGFIKFVLSTIVMVFVLLAGAAALVSLILYDAMVVPDNTGSAGLLNIDQPSVGPDITRSRTRDTQTFDTNLLCEPPATYGPWTRWWWPGGLVDKNSLELQLREIGANGIAGVEIQPLDSGLGLVHERQETKGVFDFDNEIYYDRLAHVMEVARELGMQVDLTHLSGFPGGGPQVSLDQGVQSLVYADLVIEGAREIDIELPVPSPNSSDWFNAFFETVAFGPEFANFAGDRGELLSVLAYRITSGSRSKNPFNTRDQLFLEPSTLQVLTDRISDGRVRWSVPEGKWAIVVVYRVPTAEPPLVSAYRPQGFVVDHLNPKLLTAHYEHAYGSRTGLDKYFGNVFRGIFNDSFEFRADRIAGDNIAEEFRKRRGYDLEPVLPALFEDGADNFWFSKIVGLQAKPDFVLTEVDERIVYDYNQTVSDLFVEEFLEPADTWAAVRGLETRSQVYGLEIDLIRAFGATSIPETETLAEGGAELWLKIASGAGALYDRPVISAETLTFGNKDNQVTPQLVKGTADKLLAAGINQIVYHGTPYQFGNDWEEVFGEPGWHPFATPDAANFAFGSNISPAAQFWTDYRQINRYITRAQYIMQAGRPDWDVLIYFPFLGYPFMEFLKYTDGEPFIHGNMPDAPYQLPGVGETPFHQFIDSRSDPRGSWMADVKHLSDALAAKGFSWTWTNGHALKTSSVVDSGISIGGNEFRAIVVPGVNAMPVEILQHLGALARNGVAVFVLEKLPAQVPGYWDYATEDARTRAAANELIDAGATLIPIAELEKLTTQLQGNDRPIRHDATANLRRASRRLENGGYVHFFANLAPRLAAVSISIDAANAFWFDAMSGQFSRFDTESSDQFRLELAPYQSMFLISGIDFPYLPDDTRLNLMTAEFQLLQELNDWSLAIERSVDGPEVNEDKFELADWRSVEQLKYRQGPARYRSSFDLEDASAESILLDLGHVDGAIDAYINGQLAGSLVASPFLIDISASVRAGTNDIAIELRTAQHNSYAGRALRGEEAYAQFKEEAEQDLLIPVGLRGPVNLIEGQSTGNRESGQCNLGEDG